MRSYGSNTAEIRNGLPMTDDEIIQSWKNAICRKDQVDILSQLNDCPKKRIVEILFEGGYSRDRLFTNTAKRVCFRRKQEKKST